jgi:hypothetical protein
MLSSTAQQSSGEVTTQALCVVTLSLTLLGLLLQNEDGGDMLLRNVGYLTTDYTMVQISRPYSL